MKWIITIFIFFSLTTLLNARMDRYDERGFRISLQYCKQCHGDPYKVAGMMKSRHWKKIFSGNAKKLISIHKKTPYNKGIHSFLRSKSKTKHLRKFLMQSASDSGVVIGCDGNYCGH